MRVHLLHPPDEHELTLLTTQLSPQIQLTTGGTLPSNLDWLVAGVPTREHLESHPELTGLIIPWAGIPTKTRELMADFPNVAIHNLHHNAGPVAEMMLTLLLSAAKLLLPFDQSLRQNDWTPRYEATEIPVLSLAGKTAVILGYGAIGQRIGAHCQALGMRVLGTRRQLTQPEETATGVVLYPAAALTDLLPQANVLLICLPLTDETRGVIGEAELELMPPRGVLVNVGRGAVVAEEALYQALKNGRLHAAGLDVWYQYPADQDARTSTPPSSYPFHELPNVVMSPHRASLTDRTEALRMEALAVLLNTAVSGQPMPNRLELGRGY